MGILGAKVDVSHGGTDGDAGDGHPLDQDVRVAFHDHAIGEGAGVALVGVADDVLLVGRGTEHRLPLDASGECSATTTAKAGGGHRIHDRRRGHSECVRETAISAIRDVVVERDGIGDADAREGEPLLPGEVRVLLSEAKGELVRLTLEEAGIEQAGDIGGVYGTVGHTSRGRLHLHHRLEPEQATRAIAHEVHIEPAHGGLGGDGASHLLGAHREGGRVARHVDADHGFASRSSMTAANRLGVTRP